MSANGCAPASPQDIQPTGEDFYFRLDGDKKDKRGGACLTIDGDFAHGNYINFKTGEKGSWHSRKSDKTMSEDERKAIKDRIAASEKARKEARDKLQADKADEARKLWDSLKPCSSHPYLERKGVGAFNARTDGADLILPMYATDGKIYAYQRITPDGGKWYQAGARKNGLYCPLAVGTPVKDMVILCEGFATGASIRMAMPDVPVIVCFDAYNLMHVATAIRAKYKATRIIMAADNDESKTGQERAQQAADKVGGFTCCPDDVGTDWNDVHLAHGLDIIKAKFGEAAPPPSPVPDGIQSTPIDLQPVRDTNYEPPNLDDVPDDDYEREGDAPPKTKKDGGKRHYKILGYSGDEYYYFPYAKKQIVTLTPSSHNINNLIQLAPLSFWRKEHSLDGSVPDSKVALTAADILIEQATKQGIFDHSTSVRGCGAWMDAGRVILHCGDRLYVDGKETQIIDLKSKFIYVASARLIQPHKNPITNAEAIKLRELCEMPSWENKLSGSLLAGWLVVAPICAALDWRPHIWVTGQAESGKSTIMDKIIQPALGSYALRLDGGTTEPAIRSMMRYDARPIIYDEAEGEGKAKTIMQGVMSTVRLASSGGTVKKFGQDAFTARFMVCFSAIRPPITEFADETRISMLKLKQNRSASAAEDYRKLLVAISETITPDFAERMLSRIILNMPALLENIKTFRKAATVVIKGARASDQIAPMLAGLFFLHGTGVISQAKAEEFIRAQDWSFHTAIAEDTDPTRCVQHFCSHLVRYSPTNGTQIDVSIADLIDSCYGKNNDIGINWARKTLQGFGVVCKDDGIAIANRGEQLEKIFRGTPWSVGWKSAFESIEGHVKMEKTHFSSGNRQRGTKIPLSVIYE